MKRKVVKFMLVCALLSIAITASGCGLFNSENSNNSSTAIGGATYKFSIKYDDELTKYSFKSKNSIYVSPRYKEGYVLEGFYTRKSGNGTKMLDWDGSCLSSGFSGDGSTVLYPYYKEINYDYVAISSVFFEENPKTASYNVYGEPTKTYDKLEKVINIDYILKVATANPNLHFTLTATGYFYDDPGRFYVGIGKSVDKGSFLNYISFDRPSRYTQMSVSADIKGKTLTIEDTNIMIGVFCTTFGHSVYYKNIQFKISIVKPQTQEEQSA